MDGLYIIKKDDPSRLSVGRTSFLTLILKRPNLEIMRQSFKPRDTVWIAAADDKSMIELFYVLEGELDIYDAEQRTDTLRPGDVFYVDHLTRDVRICPTTAGELLYITNLPVFDGLCAFQRNLNSLLTRINDKDKTTLTHSRSVSLYSIALFELLKPEGLILDDLTTAALFHDVGKCYVPTEILRKEGSLTIEEYELMKLHAINSYDILLNCYGATIATIARSHHERLDGSGYPDGIEGADIGIGPRIIAVADAYDAMTSPRTYNRIKTPEEAIAELRSLPRKYDQSVVNALAKLYKAGRLVPRDGVKSE